MPSVIDICNYALRNIGETPVTSLDDETKSARACSDLWVPTRDYVQSLFEWPECLSRVTLVEASSPPNHEWENKFQLPSDFLRVVAIYEHDTFYDDWRLEGGYILTNHSSVKLLYIKKNSDPTTWSPFLLQCTTYRLAADLCLSLSARTDRREQMEQLFWNTLIHAKGRHAMSQRPIKRQDSWIDVRW